LLQSLLRSWIRFRATVDISDVLTEVSKLLDKSVKKLKHGLLLWNLANMNIRAGRILDLSKINLDKVTREQFNKVANEC
jgi:hypothetical protein